MFPVEERKQTWERIITKFSVEEEEEDDDVDVGKSQMDIVIKPQQGIPWEMREKFKNSLTYVQEWVNESPDVTEVTEFSDCDSGKLVSGVLVGGKSNNRNNYIEDYDGTTPRRLECDIDDDHHGPVRNTRSRWKNDIEDCDGPARNTRARKSLLAALESTEPIPVRDKSENGSGQFDEKPETDNALFVAESGRYPHDHVAENINNDTVQIGVQNAETEMLSEHTESLISDNAKANSLLDSIEVMLPALDLASDALKADDNRLPALTHDNESGNGVLNSVKPVTKLKKSTEVNIDCTISEEMIGSKGIEILENCSNSSEHPQKASSKTILYHLPDMQDSMEKEPTTLHTAEKGTLVVPYQEPQAVQSHESPANSVPYCDSGFHDNSHEEAACFKSSEKLKVQDGDKKGDGQICNSRMQELVEKTPEREGDAEQLITSVGKSLPNYNLVEEASKSTRRCLPNEFSRSEEQLSNVALSPQIQVTSKRSEYYSTPENSTCKVELIRSEFSKEKIARSCVGTASDCISSGTKRSSFKNECMKKNNFWRENNLIEVQTATSSNFVSSTNTSKHQSDNYLQSQLKIQTLPEAHDDKLAEIKSLDINKLCLPEDSAAAEEIISINGSSSDISAADILPDDLDILTKSSSARVKRLTYSRKEENDPMSFFAQSINTLARMAAKNVEQFHDRNRNTLVDKNDKINKEISPPGEISKECEEHCSSDNNVSVDYSKRLLRVTSILNQEINSSSTKNKMKRNKFQSCSGDSRSRPKNNSCRFKDQEHDPEISQFGDKKIINQIFSRKIISNDSRSTHLNESMKSNLYSTLKNGVKESPVKTTSDKQNNNFHITPIANAKYFSDVINHVDGYLHATSSEVEDQSKTVGVVQKMNGRSVAASSTHSNKRTERNLSTDLGKKIHTNSEDVLAKDSDSSNGYSPVFQQLKNMNNESLKFDIAMKHSLLETIMSKQEGNTSLIVGDSNSRPSEMEIISPCQSGSKALCFSKLNVHTPGLEITSFPEDAKKKNCALNKTLSQNEIAEKGNCDGRFLPPLSHNNTYPGTAFCSDTKIIPKANDWSDDFPSKRSTNWFGKQDLGKKNHAACRDLQPEDESSTEISDLNKAQHLRENINRLQKRIGRRKPSQCVSESELQTADNCLEENFPASNTVQSISRVFTATSLGEKVMMKSYYQPTRDHEFEEDRGLNSNVKQVSRAGNVIPVENDLLRNIQPAKGPKLGHEKELGSTIKQASINYKTVDESFRRDPPGRLEFPTNILEKECAQDQRSSAAHMIEKPSVVKPDCYQKVHKGSRSHRRKRRKPKIPILGIDIFSLCDDVDTNQFAGNSSAQRSRTSLGSSWFPIEQNSRTELGIGENAQLTKRYGMPVEHVESKKKKVHHANEPQMRKPSNENDRSHGVFFKNDTSSSSFVKMANAKYFSDVINHVDGYLHNTSSEVDQSKTIGVVQKMNDRSAAASSTHSNKSTEKNLSTDVGKKIDINSEDILAKDSDSSSSECSPVFQQLKTVDDESSKLDVAVKHSLLETIMSKQEDNTSLIVGDSNSRPSEMVIISPCQSRGKTLCFSKLNVHTPGLEMTSFPEDAKKKNCALNRTLSQNEIAEKGDCDGRFLPPLSHNNTYPGTAFCTDTKIIPKANDSSDDFPSKRSTNWFGKQYLGKKNHAACRDLQPEDESSTEISDLNEAQHLRETINRLQKRIGRRKPSQCVSESELQTADNCLERSFTASNTVQSISRVSTVKTLREKVMKKSYYHPTRDHEFKEDRSLNSNVKQLSLADKLKNVYISSDVSSRVREEHPKSVQVEGRSFSHSSENLAKISTSNERDVGQSDSGQVSSVENGMSYKIQPAKGSELGHEKQLGSAMKQVRITASSKTVDESPRRNLIERSGFPTNVLESMEESFPAGNTFQSITRMFTAKSLREKDVKSNHQPGTDNFSICDDLDTNQIVDNNSARRSQTSLDSSRKKREMFVPSRVVLESELQAAENCLEESFPADNTFQSLIRISTAKSLTEKAVKSINQLGTDHEFEDGGLNSNVKQVSRAGNVIPVENDLLCKIQPAKGPKLGHEKELGSAMKQASINNSKTVDESFRRDPTGRLEFPINTLEKECAQDQRSSAAHMIEKPSAVKPDCYQKLHKGSRSHRRKRRKPKIPILGIDIFSLCDDVDTNQFAGNNSAQRSRTSLGSSWFPIEQNSRKELGTGENAQLKKRYGMPVEHVESKKKKVCRVDELQIRNPSDENDRSHGVFSKNVTRNSSCNESEVNREKFSMFGSDTGFLSPEANNCSDHSSSKLSGKDLGRPLSPDFLRKDVTACRKLPVGNSVKDLIEIQNLKQFENGSSNKVTGITPSKYMPELEIIDDTDQTDDTASTLKSIRERYPGLNNHKTEADKNLLKESMECNKQLIAGHELNQVNSIGSRIQVNLAEKFKKVDVLLKKTHTVKAKSSVNVLEKEQEKFASHITEKLNLERHSSSCQKQGKKLPLHAKSRVNRKNPFLDSDISDVEEPRADQSVPSDSRICTSTDMLEKREKENDAFVVESTIKQNRNPGRSSEQNKNWERHIDGKSCVYRNFSSDKLNSHLFNGDKHCSEVIIKCGENDGTVNCSENVPETEQDDINSSTIECQETQQCDLSLMVVHEVLLKKPRKVRLRPYKRVVRL